MDHTNVSRERWHDHWLFLTHFRKSPRTVGAIAPSSQRLARAMLDGLSLEPGVRLVELGPGTGAVTGEIARRLPENAACLAIDVDPVFSSRVGCAMAANRLGLRPGRTAGRDRPRAQPLTRRSHRFRPPVCKPACGECSRDRRGDRLVAASGRQLYHVSVRPRVRVPFGSERPADLDAGDGVSARPRARPREPAPGPGAPLAQA